MKGRESQMIRKESMQVQAMARKDVDKSVEQHNIGVN